MKDFDFEELDRAVNSALEDTAPQKDLTAVPKSMEVSATPRPSAPAARRSGGRFMDMVHPQSDMRRPGVPSQAPVVPKPAATQVPKEMPREVEAPVAEETPMQESPFLPNAVVEKRPLGASVPASVAMEALMKEPDEPLLESPDEPRIEAFAEPDPAPSQVVETPEPAVSVSSEAERTHVQDAPATSPGAMFDAEVYHQPTPVPRKTSAWSIILWVIALIILGVAAGYSVYTFVLPNL